MNERFYEYLRIKNLSQRRLAELSGVSLSSVTRFCHGSPIASDKLLRLLQVCDDLSLEWLFYASGDMLRSHSASTMNIGPFAGADIVTKDSIMVKNSNDVRLPGVKDRHIIDVLAEKDRIILEKDRIILEKDRMIAERDQMISSLQGNRL